ncbi:HAD-superfamily hydrolase, subfamily IA, variant 3 [Methanoregula boonei 6A8]|uniref:HAD-superfamily hydrolase, subfamily IA, variant 3 n=1 Tax=Methanoregula boonei (strain DSM 21154 / JCM 14090 / 6A8) TaxID=456442 RepID=A7I7I2_METB6|nr:HAD-IA family hydrolase [Methanoregula boonei]ABS55693.1 HAD-superfamily hydrolase, subfamily IA, variant 3 [Methanoregula boonei 6A8]
MSKESFQEDIRTRPARALLFDMDNTLFDLVGAQIAACESVVRHLGYDDGDDLFLYFLNGSHGFESTENIRQYMEERRIPTNGMYEQACRIYASEKLRNVTPYPGVAKTLAAVRERGYTMALVTDAEHPDARLRLDKCGLTRFFDCMVTYDKVGVKKPAPDPFLAALRAVDARPHEALFIGDSPRRDIEPCNKLGIRTVYARYGDRFSKTRDNIAADFVIDRMDELLRILAPIPVAGSPPGT